MVDGSSVTLNGGSLLFTDTRFTMTYSLSTPIGVISETITGTYTINGSTITSIADGGTGPENSTFTLVDNVLTIINEDGDVQRFQMS